VSASGSRWEEAQWASAFIWVAESKSTLIKRCAIDIKERREKEKENRYLKKRKADCNYGIIIVVVVADIYYYYYTVNTVSPSYSSPPIPCSLLHTLTYPVHI